jgi:hypothetical protein
MILKLQASHPIQVLILIIIHIFTHFCVYFHENMNKGFQEKVCLQNYTELDRVNKNSNLSY